MQPMESQKNVAQEGQFQEIQKYRMIGKLPPMFLASAAQAELILR